VRLKSRALFLVENVQGPHSQVSIATIEEARWVGRFGWGVGRFRGCALSIGVLVGSLGPVPSEVLAEHEIDHRFIVEGFVCGSDDKAVPEAEVMVKDTRVSVGKMGYTDNRGHYTVTLHLHNDNQGDPILITTKDQEQRIAATFDPKDLKTERKVTVNFGTGCVTQEESSPWVYYGVGLGVAVVAAVAGARLMRKRRQPVKRGKGKRSQSNS
jgi:hypothetical protein